MEKKSTAFAFFVAVMVPGPAFADAVRITGDTGVTVPDGAFESEDSAYFGLKGQDDLSSRLRGRVLQYWTPNFEGLNAGIKYASDRDAARLLGNGAVANDLSFSLEYKFGKASAFVGSESGWGGNPFGLAHSDVHMGAAYGFSTGTRFGLGYGQSRYNFSPSESGSFDTLAKGGVQMNDWYLSLVQDVGSSGHIRFSFSQADNVNQGTANQLSLGYGQALSKQTEVYALYTRTNNIYNFATNPFGLGVGSSIFGLALKHSF